MMKFNRLLMAGLTALFCAGTAMAASQLNSVNVTPKENTATVSLQTTGSFAHKEYRPDEHLMLVDLTGVTSDPGLVRTVMFRSPVLKSYVLSSYTSPAGSEVTRLELSLGDNVKADVVDGSNGLEIQLSEGAPAISSAAVASSPATAPAEAAASKSAQTVSPDAGAQPVAAMSSQTGRSTELEKKDNALLPIKIRNVSIETGQDTVDVIVAGPSEANPYLLKNPDRLVVDFKNAAIPAARTIAVRTKDVLKVRVGLHQATPPMTRVVIELGGPRDFEVLPSADQVIVRIKNGTLSQAKLRRKAAPAPAVASKLEALPAQKAENSAGAVVASASTPAAMPVSMPVSAPVAMSVAVPAPVTPADARPAPAPVASAPAKPQDQPVSGPIASSAMAADMTAPASQAAKAAVAIASSSPAPAVQLPDSPSQASAPAAPRPKYTGEPISVNLKDVDLKDFFRLIHEISGLNIVLDPSVHGTVTLVLDDVPWDQALDIVLKNNSLDRELQGNVLRIAATDTLRREAVDRRAESEAVALAVDRQTIARSLSYAKAKDIVPTVKKFLTARGDVISDERTNALIISDIPSVLPALDHLISQLDKKTQEVEIEVRVVSATRSFSRDLGFQLGFNWGNGVSTIAGSNPNGSTSAGTTTTTTSTSSVPLFSNFPATGATTGLSFSNITSSYGIDAILTAAESHSLAKVLSRPRVVTQSNAKAEVRQGVQIPVYTAGTANANSSVTYVNAELRLSVLPQITADHTIFLTVDVENTQPGPLTATGNYILNTQQASTQVLVTDGATVVIGGVIQTNNSVSTSQTPVLGDIPWLGNLFKHRSVSTETDELIFFITPKIIQT